MKRTIYLFIFIAFVYSCNIKSPYLGNGYELSENTEYGEDIAINRNDTSFYHIWDYGDSTIQAGVLVKFHRQNKEIDSSFLWEGASVVSSYIDSYSYDDLFIIVKNKDLDSVWGSYYTDKDNGRSRRKQPSKASDAIKMLMQSDIIQYWIINKISDDIYGPYKEAEYLHKREELGVSKELKFEGK